ncbi:membrane protein [Bacteroidia bacterium]|nr:membrane protein [Bacteroidia bacterium]
MRPNYVENYYKSLKLSIMKRNVRVAAIVAMLSVSVLFSSCIGSFALTNKVLKWNSTFSDKFVNELVYIVFWIVPVYEASLVIDGLVLNTLEFWTGSNPVLSDNVQTIKTDNGVFIATTTAQGHKIQKEGSDEIVEFRFNEAENSWSFVTANSTTKLLQFVDDNHADVYLANGSTMTVTTDKAGVLALKEVVSSTTYLAYK